jgi:hypothetical protein
MLRASVVALLVFNAILVVAALESETCEAVVPNDSVRRVGESANLKCKISSLSSSKISWVFCPRDGAPYQVAANCDLIPSTVDSYRLDKTDGACNLAIDNITESHYGTYTCQDLTLNNHGFSMELAPAVLDCADLLRRYPSSVSGVYNITGTLRGESFAVYCDMKTSGGGWTVFQRRIDGSTNFYRQYAEYANGFGDPANEFWLGNEHLAALTAARDYRLRVDLGDFAGNFRYAEYNLFKVANSTDKYRLTSIGAYIGDAGNSLNVHKGSKFSTYESDNDGAAADNCASIYHGAWWYNTCHESNLNGEYNNKVFGVGPVWLGWLGYTTPLRFTEMKIRPVF